MTSQGNTLVTHANTRILPLLVAYIVSWPGPNRDEVECEIVFAATPDGAKAKCISNRWGVDEEAELRVDRASLLDPWVDSPTLPLFLQLLYVWLPCDVCGSWVRGDDEDMPGYFDGGVYCSEQCHARETGEEWAEDPGLFAWRAEVARYTAERESAWARGDIG